MPFVPLRHSSHKSTGILVLNQHKPNANVTAIPLRTGKIFCHFIEMDIPMIHFDEKLQRTLQPHIEAAQAGRLYDRPVVEIAERRVLQPRHQKSSALGIRL